MAPHSIAVLALVLAALAMLLLAGALMARIASARRSERTLADALERRSAQTVAGATSMASRADAARGAPVADDAMSGARRGSAASAGTAGVTSGATVQTTGMGGAASGAAVRPAGTAGMASGAGAQTAGTAKMAVAPGTPGAPANAAMPTQPLRRSRHARLRRVLDRAARVGGGWLDTPPGRLIVADEDRRLLEQCGFVDARARGLFLVARLACAIVLPAVAAACAEGRIAGTRFLALVLIALVAGFMLPKLLVRRRAAARRDAVVDELPLLVDLLRLLQGVGLSLDQSLQVTINDFRRMLPVLASELEIAQRQFAAGRTREQSLQRLASSFDNEDLRAVVRLLIQVDRHGGAVQEPLRQFGDRLRDGRRALLREKIGRLTVKMTGVMVVTLLPALLIVTAGPGVLAVLHSLSQHTYVRHR